MSKRKISTAWQVAITPGAREVLLNSMSSRNMTLETGFLKLSVDSTQPGGVRIDLVNTFEPATHEFTIVAGLQIIGTLSEVIWLNNLLIDVEQNPVDTNTKEKLVINRVEQTSEKKPSIASKVGAAVVDSLRNEVAEEIGTYTPYLLMLVTGAIPIGIAYMIGDVRKFMDQFGVLVILGAAVLGVMESTFLSRFNDKLFPDWSDILKSWKFQLGLIVLLIIGLFLGIANNKQAYTDQQHQDDSSRERARRARQPEPVDVIKMAEELKERRDARAATSKSPPSPTTATSPPLSRYPRTRSLPPADPD